MHSVNKINAKIQRRGEKKHENNNNNNNNNDYNDKILTIPNNYIYNINCFIIMSMIIALFHLQKYIFKN